MSSFESGADISIIIDISTQKGAECSRKRQFNRRTAHFLSHSRSSPLPILFPKPQRPWLILFFPFCFSLRILLSPHFISLHLYLPLLICLFMCLTRAGATALALRSISFKCFSLLTPQHIHLPDPETLLFVYSCVCVQCGALVRLFSEELPPTVPIMVQKTGEIPSITLKSARAFPISASLNRSHAGDLHMALFSTRTETSLSHHYGNAGSLTDSLSTGCQPTKPLIISPVMDLTVQCKKKLEAR